MVAHQQSVESMSCRPVLRWYTLLELVEEVLNDRDSDDEDMLGLDQSDSDEGETELN